MAIELVNIGKIANDGTGDDLREAFTKINRSLEELDLRIDDKTEGVNVGSGTGVFYRRDGYDLQYKSLTSTDGTVSITDNVTSIDIKVQNSTTDIPLVTDSGAFTLPRNTTLNIRGTGSVSTEADELNNTINIVGGSSLADDPNPSLNSSLSANLYNILNVNNISAQNIESLVYGVDIRSLAALYTEMDFGSIGSGLEVNSLIEFLAASADVDLGSITNPSNVSTDFGSFV